MPVLITGVAGFIGFHVARRLCEAGIDVVGIDNLNAYYSVELKLARLQRLFGFANFRFQTLDIANSADLQQLFARQAFSEVIHLAAQAGVRYSLDNPGAYGQANLVGFLNILEACRQQPPRHLIYASSSSVYGANAKLPFSIDDPVEQPVSLYAASKRANELMAHSYAHLYRIPTTGLRFFTVYGPWGRPDMAPMIFTRKILAAEPIEVFNEGRHERDFTYVDDIVEGVRRIVDRVPEPNADWSGDHPDPGTSRAPYRIYNIGNHQPIELLHMIETLERALGVTAVKELLPMQPGDVPATYADIEDLTRATGFTPTTSIEDGIARFVHWYRDAWLPIVG